MYVFGLSGLSEIGNRNVVKFCISMTHSTHTILNISSYFFQNLFECQRSQIFSDISLVLVIFQKIKL